jgi:3-methyl-2-oxobutanoate hydroxymethyltransferase
MDRITAPKFAAMKAEGQPIVCVTAYDKPSAEIAEAAGVDAILVGDSLGNVLLGYDTTLPVELEDIAYHTRAVARGASRALVIGDLPFGSYQSSVPAAVDASVFLMKNGAAAVKLEGAYVAEAAAIVRAGIPCMGHLGFTPQSVHAFGGHKVQGRGDGADVLLEEALALEDAGVFGIVLELMPADVASLISHRLRIPTIGIGAGAGCDGQIQVWHDVVGLSAKQYRHAHAYCSGRKMFTGALTAYTDEVRARTFPRPENSF